MRPDAIIQIRAQSRRPIPDEEVPDLEALGRELVGYREMFGLARSSVAELALLHPSHLWRLELGLRRTRRSTLERIVAAFMELADDEVTEAVTADEVLTRLLAAAGSSLAEESRYQERMLRRAKRRQRRKNLEYLREARQA
jgi:hypothetical protein